MKQISRNKPVVNHGRKTTSFVRTSLPYLPVGRKLLLFDPIEDGEFPRYRRDPAMRSSVIPKRGSTPSNFVDPDEFVLPLFEIAANPITALRDERSYPGTHARGIARAKDSLVRQEDIEVFKALNTSLFEDHRVTTGAISPGALRQAMGCLEEHELICEAITMHPRQWTVLSECKHPKLIVYCMKDARKTGVWGYFYKTPIYVASMCPRNAVFVTAARDIVGRIAVRVEPTAIADNDTRKLRMGHVIFEELGIGIMNPHAIACILIPSEDDKKLSNLSEAISEIVDIDAEISDQDRAQMSKERKANAWVFQDMADDQIDSIIQNAKSRKKSSHGSRSAPAVGAFKPNVIQLTEQLEKLSLSQMEMNWIQEAIDGVKGQRVARNGTPEDVQRARQAENKCQNHINDTLGETK